MIEPLASNQEVQQLNHTFHSLRVQALCPEGDDALLVTLEVPPALQQLFAFQPGQHLTLRLGEERRSYSICSAPGQALQVGVRHVLGGQVSGWLHRHLQVGSMLEVMPPTGSFGAVLRQRPKHVLLVAGGSGITPMMSIAQAVLSTCPAGRVTLLYSNRMVASTMFKEALEDLKNRHLHRFALHTVFSREDLGSQLHQGRLDADKVAHFMRLVGPVDEAFVCGPHEMNDAVHASLLRAGMQTQHIHIERFGVAPSVGSMAATSDVDSQPSSGSGASRNGGAGQGQLATVGIVRDGLRRDVAFSPADGNILAAATRAGLDMPYSCKSGVCATCRCRLLQGQVEMARNFALQADDLARGFVLSCQARPTTAHVVLSFDER